MFVGLVLAARAKTAAVAVAPATPVAVIVPGSLHSVLEMRLHAAHPPAPHCPTDLPWTTVYPNRTWLAPPLQQCWIGYMARRVLPNGTTVALDGVEVRTAGWGGVGSIPAVDPWTFPNASAYTALIHTLTGNSTAGGGGMVPGEHLFAAPFDWRLAPDELALPPPPTPSPRSTRGLARAGSPGPAHGSAGAGGWYDALNALLLSASERNSGRRVWVLAHSSGPSYLQYWLAHHCPTAIKEDVLAGVVSFNGNFAGEIDCLETLWEGGTFGPPFLPGAWDAAAYRRTQATWGITAWCMPQPAAYQSRQLVTSAAARGLGVPGPGGVARSFAARDIPALIKIVGLDTLLAVYTRVANLTSAAAPRLPPESRYVCLFGVGVPTPVRYAFGPRGPAAGHPSVTTADTGDGQQDGTTNQACTHWGGTTTTHAFKGADHDSLLADPRALELVVQTLRGAV